MSYCVYIITNYTNSVLYTGVTNNLFRRILEHKNKKNKNSFSGRYNCYKLVYYECGSSICSAIDREKQIKAGSRADKVKLIEEMNPEWKDLFCEISG